MDSGHDRIEKKEERSQKMDYSNATNEELENLVSQKKGDAI